MIAFIEPLALPRREDVRGLHLFKYVSGRAVTFGLAILGSIPFQGPERVAVPIHTRPGVRELGDLLSPRPQFQQSAVDISSRAVEESPLIRKIVEVCRVAYGKFLSLTLPTKVLSDSLG